MRKCPKCGTENSDQAQFCVNCGNKFTSNQTSTSNMQQKEIVCPKCGKLNPLSSKFCRYCGTPLKTTHDKDNNEPNLDQQSQQPAESTYNRQQYHEQQPRPFQQNIAAADNFFQDYFRWFKDTLIHPLSQFSDNPYFGTTSFGITAIFLWIAEYISKSNPQIFGESAKLFSYMPDKNYYRILNNTNLLWLLILTLLTIVVYWLIDYIFDLFIGHPRANIFFVGNHLAGLTNLTTITALLVLVGSALGSAFIVWLFVLLTKLIFLTGLFYAVESSVKGKNSLHISKLYIAMVACLICYVLQGLLFIVIGDVFL